VLVALIALAFAFGLNRYLSFDALARNRALLLAFVDAHPLLAPVIFAAAYAAVVALSIPGASTMTLAAGFLFGTLLGGLITVAAATVGAIIVFLIARTALGDVLRDRAGPRLARMEAGFRENALSYLLVLRLVPLFPFWLVNVAPAVLGVSLGVYAFATFVGIMPATFVFASIGNGLGAVFDQGGKPDLSLLLKPAFILPLVGLGLLALIPVGYKWWKRRAAQ
jgi:uncharacterized membrane protein YdjX (TVP38/TMEM64 family)